MLAPAGLSLLVTSYPGQQERSHALGIYGAIASTGFASGAVLGGLLAEVTWRLVFFVNAPVGVALLIASFRLLPPDPPSSKGQLDVPGAITVTAGVALLVFAVARAGDTLRVTQPALLGGAAIVLLGRSSPGRGRPGPRYSTWPCSRTAASGSQPGPDRGRRLQRRAGAADDPVPAGGTRAQPAAHRPVLRPAGGGGVLAGRASQPAGAHARPRRALAAGLSLALLALAGGAVSVLAGSLPALLAVCSCWGRQSPQPGRGHPGRHPGTGRRPVRGHGQRPADRHQAVRRCARRGDLVRGARRRPRRDRHRTEVAMFVAAGFALAGLLATREVPPGPPHPQTPKPQHLFRHHAGGLP